METVSSSGEKEVRILLKRGAGGYVFVLSGMGPGGKTDLEYPAVLERVPAGAGPCGQTVSDDGGWLKRAEEERDRLLQDLAAQALAQEQRDSFLQQPASSNAPEPVGDAAESFVDAFLLVQANPLPGNLPCLLWLLAQETPRPLATEAPPSPLRQAADRFEALIRTQGVHYIETTSVMGVDMKAEYWLKGDMFKKVDMMTREVVIFDGEWLYRYPSNGKTGVRQSPEAAEAADTIARIRNNMLASMADSPFRQLEDAKVKGFDCQVFYRDLGTSTYNSHTICVDRKTGALVRSQYGDEKTGMTISMSKLETGKFKDDVFTVPKNVRITGP